MSTTEARLRRESLRRQVALLEHVRDAVAREPSGEYERWAEALTGLTDELLHELMEMEGVAPYLHPRGVWEKWLEVEPMTCERTEELMPGERLMLPRGEGP